VELLSARIQTRKDARKETAMRMMRDSIDAELEKSEPGAWSKALNTMATPLDGAAKGLANFGSGILSTGMSHYSAKRVASFERKKLADEGGSNEGDSDLPARRTRCSGLKWVDVDRAKPNPGVELTHRVLQEALGRGYTEFTQEEWDAFNIKELVLIHYVFANGRYFVPAAVFNAVPVVPPAGEATGLSAKTRWRKSQNTTPESPATLGAWM